MRNCPRPPRRRFGRTDGFTLLELLVVMIIAGIVVSLVAVNAMPNDRGRVIDDGQRIARLFELAQEEAQLRARAIAWEADGIGWRFLESTPNGWMPLSGALTGDVLGPGRWRLPLDSVAVTAGGRGAGSGRLIFGREPVGEPQQLVLMRGGIRVDVNGDGSGRFSAQPR